MAAATTIQNPFTMSDAQIDDEVCHTDRSSSHESYDSSSLLIVVDNIIIHATHVVDNHVLMKNPSPVEQVDVNFLANNFDPKFSMLKHIFCQMHCTPWSEESAHKTTISILENVATFSWESKAVLALAAFAREYGTFWHLVQSPITDTLAHSLALLNRVPAIVSPPALPKHKRAITELNEMVKTIVELVKAIAHFHRLFSTNKCDEEDVPHLYEALTHIRIDTYWAILAIVVCSTQITALDYKYQLSRYHQKLQSILTQLKYRLEHAIDEIEDLRPLPSNPTDIVEFLKSLIIHHKHIPQPSLFDGSSGQMVAMDVLRKKNVLLFISGLDRIEDEIVLLTPIYNAITRDKDKKDYKIVWLPIVNQWKDQEKAKFEDLKKKMPWYVVEYFSAVRQRKHIVDKWQYKIKPMVVVLDSKGNVVNPNAMHMIFSWGIRAFPFHDDAPLCQQWNWLWFNVSKYYPHIKKWIDDNKYIFFYGGQDKVWMDKFSKQLKAIAEDDKMKKADCEIELFHLVEDNTNVAASFWVEINELFATRIQKKSDSVIKEVEKFLSFKNESGWALLAKGRNVVKWDYREVMWAVVLDFERWKEQVPHKGFDVAFVDYYNIKREGAPHHCAHIRYENVRSKVPESVKCPDCDHVMEIASVHYRCCHGLVDSSAPRAHVKAPLV